MPLFGPWTRTCAPNRAHTSSSPANGVDVDTVTTDATDCPRNDSRHDSRKGDLPYASTTKVWRGPDIAVRP
jgi:hypothetical protein